MGEFGNDYITLIDDDGNEVEMEHLDTLEQDGVVYMAFAVADEEVEEDAADLVILKVEADENSDEEILSTIEDEEKLEELYQLFMDRLEDLYEFTEEEGGPDQPEE